MKRWAFVTVGLYASLLLLLTFPAILLASFGFSEAKGWHLDPSVVAVSDAFREWGYWVILGVLVVAQLLLLIVPVNLAERRLPSRRKLVIPVITASFLLGNLMLAGVFSIVGAFFGDDGSAVIEQPANLAEQLVAQYAPLRAAVQALGIPPSAQLQFFYFTTTVGYLLVSWLVWALLFYHHGQADEPEDLIRRSTRWLLRASILELLVAVPSHIIIRHRNDCCAPVASFWGIVTGISVMLLAFGPGVFFLFAQRFRHAQVRRAHRPTTGSSSA